MIYNPIAYDTSKGCYKSLLGTIRYNKTGCWVFSVAELYWIRWSERCSYVLLKPFNKTPKGLYSSLPQNIVK